MPTTTSKGARKKGRTPEAPVALTVSPRQELSVAEPVAGRVAAALAHEVMAARLEMAPDALTEDLSLTGDLGLDEDRAVDLVIAVEEALDVRFPDDFLEGLHTYGQLHRAVHVAVQ